MCVASFLLRGGCALGALGRVRGFGQHGYIGMGNVFFLNTFVDGLLDDLEECVFGNCVVDEILDDWINYLSCKRISTECTGDGITA